MDVPTGLIAKALDFSCQALISCEKQINRIRDDGYGSIIMRIASRIQGENKTTEIAELFAKLGQISAEEGEEEMAIIFAAAAKTRPENNDPVSIVMALKKGSAEARAKSSLTKSGGVLKSLEPALGAFLDRREVDTPLAAMEAAAEAAERVTMHGTGDSSNKKDPAAHSVAVIMRSVYQAVKLKCREIGWS